MANIDNVQLPDGSSYNIVDNTSGFATQNYVDSAVSSVTKTTIGLGNVDNTSDLNKPISTATQTALDTLDEDKADKTDIATVESGTTASRAYSVGELVYVSGTLYRVKTAIASGATFTPGTNVEVTNVSEAIGEVDRGSVSVTANGIKTKATLLNELYALIDRSKLTKDTKFVINSSGQMLYYDISVFTPATPEFRFGQVSISGAGNGMSNRSVLLGGTSYMGEATITSSGTSYTNRSSEVETNGVIYMIYY